MKSLKDKMFVEENFCVRLRKLMTGMFSRESLLDFFLLNKKKKFYKRKLVRKRETFRKMFALH